MSCGCDGYLGKLEGQVRDAPFFCRAGINIGSVLRDEKTGDLAFCHKQRIESGMVDPPPRA